ncbi:MAG: hypothetical protein ACNI26_12235 [Terasakiella sp.]|uniref:hypothetical protein n=1 Tax=unclassified Terasakiella TaxID=2614952 RepID=UPI003B002028
MKLLIAAMSLAVTVVLTEAAYANNPLYPVWSKKAVTNPMTDKFEFLRYSSVSDSNRENLLMVCDGEDGKVKAFWQIATGGKGFPHSVSDLPVKYRVDKRSPISATWQVGNPRVLLLPSDIGDFLQNLKGGKKFVIQTDYTDPVSFDIKGIDTVISEITRACQ